MSDQTNVLFIIIDQLRADCLAGALADHVRLPALEALAQDAASFSRHYSVANPCGPSRASILTGQYAMNHRSVRNGTPLDGGITNIAKEVRKAGYEPWLFGYSDSTLDPRNFHPNDPEIADYERVLPGFVEKLEMRHDEGSYAWRAHLKSKGYELPDYDDFYRPAPSSPNTEIALDDPAFYRSEDSDTAFLTDAFLKEMSVRTTQNWFALLTYVRPHPPLVAPAPYNRMYQPGSLPTPIRHGSLNEERAVHPFFFGYHQQRSIENNVNGFDGQLSSDDDAVIQTLRSIYLGLATEVDHHIGRVVTFLKETGQYDNTLLIVTSDHGETLGDHYIWGKSNPYEPAWRTPLIVRDPTTPSSYGTTIREITESIDVTPTILDWLGNAPAVAMNGRSLLDLIRGHIPDKWRNYSFSELDFGDPANPVIRQGSFELPLRAANMAILREKRWKLVHFNGGLAPLLFDLQEDPGELVNLAGDPAHHDQLLRLSQKMLDHRMTHANHTLSDMQITPEGVLNFSR